MFAFLGEEAAQRKRLEAFSVLAVPKELRECLLENFPQQQDHLRVCLIF